MIPFIIVGGLAALLIYTYTGDNLLSAKDAKKFIKNGNIKVIVDVRTGAEYRLGHYPGAIHIPVSKINAQTTSRLPKSGILVYCNTGQRARFAGEKLKKLGFTDVYYIAGHYSTLV